MVHRMQTRPKLRWRRQRRSRIRADLRAAIRTNRLVEVLEVAAQAICSLWARARIRVSRTWKLDQKSICPSFS